MSRRVASIVIVVCVVGAAAVTGPPAQAFTETAGNNFFGVGAGAAGPSGAGNSFFGAAAGNQDTSGANNSFFGQDAGLNTTTGSNNAFFGRSAGIANVGGDENAIFGSGAGAAINGGSNSFFGRSAGGLSTGTSNSFFGQDAGFNTTSSGNAFFGSGAGEANTTGAANAFFGPGGVGAANTTGSSNAFFGSQAGQSANGNANSFFGVAAGAFTTGSENSFFGLRAGLLNTTGNDNAFFGVDAGFNNTANGNSFFGHRAGNPNATGQSNAFFGRDAGASNTTENANSFLGAFANGVAGITNATAVGHRAQVSQSDSLVLGSINGLNGATSNVNVGIGTATPADPLHVRRIDGNAKVLVEEASATLAGRELFQLTNNGAARFRLRNTSNNATWDFQSSSNAGSFVIDRVGGPTSLDFEMQPDGDLVVRGTATATSFITSSDRNLKTDITPAKAAKLMSLLRQLDISTWRFKSQAPGKVNLGPMAQDFHRLFGMGTDSTIDIRDLAALALVAAQELDDKNAELEKRVQRLERSGA